MSLNSSNQNIVKILSCIENANINVLRKFLFSTFISFRVTPKAKIDHVDIHFNNYYDIFKSLYAL